MAEELPGYLAGETLPPVPTAPLQPVRPVVEAGVRYDIISPLLPAQGQYDRSRCDVSMYWPGERVSVGGRASGNGEDVCKVQAQADDGALKFLTKWPINNIHYPLSPTAAWALFRFPVPAGHQARSLEYELSWYKLFGSAPGTCHPEETDPASGECLLDVTAGWRNDVPAGVFLLWARPGDPSFTFTGPHQPLETIGYSGHRTFQVPVPEAYRDADELVVVFLIFNQYTKGCEAGDPTRCTLHENENLELHALGLKTVRPFQPLHLPPRQHPRILGTGDQWSRYWRPLESMDCMDLAPDSDWGAPFNVKNVWDENTRGFAACREPAPATLDEVADAGFYLDPSRERWDRNRALRVLFLLRRLKECRASGDECPFTPAETARLQEAFLAYELERFDTISWNWGYKCFDIGTEPPLKFWSILVDLFRDDLPAAARTAIDTRLGRLADCYLEQFAARDWSIFNGNNWTPILAKAAVYWALAYYHEDARAPEVLANALESLWLHRDFYLEDGAYKEGIVEYTNVSYSNLREINNLVMQGFGIPLDSVPWQRIAGTSRWFLEFMAPDGAMVDFGDSWAKLGWSTLDPLYMLLWQEMTGERPVGTVEIDPCAVREYFRNKWFARGMEDPWSVQPSIARDWAAILQRCERPPESATAITLFPQARTGTLRTTLPGSTTLAATEGLRFLQADQTYLAVSGIPNDFPHRELDFGALIWVAHGNRLLHDFGYGEIAKTAQGRPYLVRDGDTLLYDNLPLGANTLVVEDATRDGYSVGPYDNDLIHSSQIFGEQGQVEEVRVGRYPGLHLDGGGVYGADAPELGWLDAFDRWLLALPEGSFLVIDTFRVREERGMADVREYWHTAVETDPIDTCSFSHEHVALGLENSRTLRLVPRCSRLQRQAESTVTGRITAASLHAGFFAIDPEIIRYPARNGTEILRQRVRFQADEPVAEDIRIFLLQAAPDGAEPAPATIARESCPAPGPCFGLSLAGASHCLRFTRKDNRYVLSHLSDTTCSRAGLEDSLAGLQVLTATPAASSAPWLDRTGDGRQGPADIISALQETATRAPTR